MARKGHFPLKDKTMGNGNVIKKGKNKHVRKHDLTTQEVKSKDLFSKLSEEEAGEVIIVLKRFTEIVFRRYNLLLKKRCSED